METGCSQELTDQPALSKQGAIEEDMIPSFFFWPLHTYTQVHTGMSPRKTDDTIQSTFSQPPHLPLRVCVSVCVHIHKYMGAHGCGSPKPMPGVFLLRSLLCTLRWGRPASRLASDMPCSQPPGGCRYRKLPHLHSCFMWFLGIQTPVLMSVHQALYPLTHLQGS